jgi:site-specific recombinase XerD
VNTLLDKNRITKQVEEYITYKRSLGYVIKVEAQELRRFAKYTRDIGYNGPLTVDISMNWATLIDNSTPKYMARRLETLHTLAVHVSAFDPEAQVPPNGVFGKTHSRSNPYIYTDNEVSKLMSGANKLFSPDGIRAYTVSTAIGLMYSTGIRVNELTSLKIADARLSEGYLFIRCSKFKKDRVVPLHPTVVNELKKYKVFINDKLAPRCDGDYFFVTSYGRRFNLRAFEYAFQLIRVPLFGKCTQDVSMHLPRLYDLRHSFACNTIKRWHAAGENVNQKLYLLSTYMGHVKLEDTYWYLSATPELIELASRRFENWFGGVV